jgi:hypothetical protein
MTIWMYFETDGDAGYYGIRLFSTKEKAEAYRRKKHDAYGGVEEITVDT